MSKAEPGLSPLHQTQDKSLHILPGAEREGKEAETDSAARFIGMQNLWKRNNKVTIFGPPPGPLASGGPQLYGS